MSDTDASQPERELGAYARLRDELLVRIVGVLHADSRVRSAWLSGSFGRGEADAWSDFDLEPELAQRLPTLGERIDPLGCLAVLRALCAAVEESHAPLQALDVAIPAEMSVQVGRLAALAEAALRSRRPTSAAHVQ